MRNLSCEVFEPVSKWLVIWVNNRRMGSVELTDANRAHIQAKFNTYLIQIDATGTEHWEMVSPKTYRR